jgi:hypothetical protein
MSIPMRSTIRFEPSLHRALRSHCASSGMTLSAVVNEMVLRALEVDQADLALARQRRREPRHSLGSVVRGMRRRGTL